MRVWIEWAVMFLVVCVVYMTVVYVTGVDLPQYVHGVVGSVLGCGSMLMALNREEKRGL